MIGRISQFLDREIPTWKMLADSPQTHSLPKVILRSHERVVKKSQSVPIKKAAYEEIKKC